MKQTQSNYASALIGRARLPVDVTGAVFTRSDAQRIWRLFLFGDENLELFNRNVSIQTDPNLLIGQ